MPRLSLSKLENCLSNVSLKSGTRIHNLTDRSIEVQIRVGSMTKSVHTLKPGSSKRLKSENLYDASMKAKKIRDKPIRNDSLYHEDEALHSYVLIHDTRDGFSKMSKQLYVSFEDLRVCYEIRAYRDHQRGCISLRKEAHNS